MEWVKGLASEQPDRSGKLYSAPSSNAISKNCSCIVGFPLVNVMFPTAVGVYQRKDLMSHASIGQELT